MAHDAPLRDRSFARHRRPRRRARPRALAAASVQSYDYSTVGSVSGLPGNVGPVEFNGLSASGTTLTTPGAFLLGTFQANPLPASATLTFADTPFTIDVLVTSQPGANAVAAAYDYKVSGLINGSITGSGSSTMYAVVTSITGDDFGLGTTPPFPVSDLSVIAPAGIAAPDGLNSGFSPLSAQVTIGRLRAAGAGPRADLDRRVRRGPRRPGRPPPAPQPARRGRQGRLKRTASPPPRAAPATRGGRDPKRTAPDPEPDPEPHRRTCILGSPFRPPPLSNHLERTAAATRAVGLKRGLPRSGPPRDPSRSPYKDVPMRGCDFLTHARASIFALGCLAAIAPGSARAAAKHHDTGPRAASFAYDTTGNVELQAAPGSVVGPATLDYQGVTKGTYAWASGQPIQLGQFAVNPASVTSGVATTFNQTPFDVEVTAPEFDRTSKVPLLDQAFPKLGRDLHLKTSTVNSLIIRGRLNGTVSAAGVSGVAATIDSVKLGGVQAHTQDHITKYTFPIRFAQLKLPSSWTIGSTATPNAPANAALIPAAYMPTATATPAATTPTTTATTTGTAAPAPAAEMLGGSIQPAPAAVLLEPTPTPEPSTIVIFAVALGGLALARRRGSI